MAEEPGNVDDNSEAAPGSPSGVELVKQRSNHLRGTVKETLDGPATHFSEEEYHLLKFHGIYQQDDRDLRSRARKEGRDKEWIMMIRAKIPGGALSADQYLAFDEISRRHADGTIRITTRQCIQLHHIGKANLKRTMQEINEALVTTLGACGDVERNLMACPAPDPSGVAAQVQQYAKLLSDRTLPSTNAYHEIWLDHEKVLSTEQEQEPLYGDLYLPRKFKSGIAIEGDNCIDVYSQDIGMVAHLENQKLAGFTMLVGGGLGKTHTDADTHPRAADPLCFVRPEDLLETFLTILKIQRDLGNRSNRRIARFKYLLDRIGVDGVRSELEARLGRHLVEPRSLSWDGTVDHLGWHEQSDGRWFLGVWVENGRIQDTDSLSQRLAFRELVEQFRPDIRLTAQQSILFTNIAEQDRAAVETLLRRHRVPLESDISNALRYSMACPAIPTCGLALAESERALPTVIRQIEAELADLGLSEERLSVRMTGCPNGCARPYLGDIGFVGRTPGKYQIYVAGDFEGTYLNQLLADLVPVDQLVVRLRPLFVQFRAERQDGEGFGSFCHRVGLDHLRSASDQLPVGSRS